MTVTLEPRKDLIRLESDRGGQVAFPVRPDRHPAALRLGAAPDRGRDCASGDLVFAVSANEGIGVAMNASFENQCRPSVSSTGGRELRAGGTLR